MNKFYLLVIGILILFGFLAKNKLEPMKPVSTPATKRIAELKPGNLKITNFATGLSKVRDLELSPGGVLLASILSDGKIVAIPKEGEVKDILIGLGNPHGIAFYKNKLFVAEEKKVARYGWDEKNLKASFEKKLLDLPSGGRHFTRSIAFDKNGQMFVSIGSTCDVCFEKHPWVGTVIVSDVDGKGPKIFARGLRNSVFVTVNPKTNELWGTEMGRDFLGDEVPPDEINILKDGRDYGWPVCYGDQVYDTNFGQKNADYCNGTEPPVYKITAHSAPLGLTFRDGYLYVTYHGSWNRSTPIGYKVVRLKVDGDQVSNEEIVLDFENGDKGRPVDMIFDRKGDMFVSDDKQGIIYRVAIKN